MNQINNTLESIKDEIKEELNNLKKEKTEKLNKNKNVPLSSYNRYVFILNILYEKKVLSFVEIKHQKNS